MLYPPKEVTEAARAESLSSLNALGSPPDERFDRITRIAEALFHVKIALINLADNDQQWINSSIGIEKSEAANNDSFCKHAVLDDEIFVVEDTLQDARFKDNPLVTGAPYIRFYAGYPIRSPQGHTIGTLCVIDPEPHEFTLAEQGYLRDLATMIEDELLLLHKTTTDELTGISNRRGFVMRSQQMLLNAQRDEAEAKICFFDLDKFKEVNDTWGHDAGDQLLIEFSKLLSGCFRANDVIARLGGDEFAVLMTGENIDVQAALDRLSNQVREKNATMDGDISWSVGIVEFIPGVHMDIDDMMADADQRMYEDKESKKVAHGI